VGLAGGAGAQKADTTAAKKSDVKKEWDVSNPQLPTRDVPIDTDSGTWMSVDVSPDGKEIVFDLLGDVYALPIGGGDAKSLTSGMAWDEHPRFSPDGRFIAFTSDRGGGDNVWIIGRDGSKPTQVTKESFRLVNSPAWTPDSEYIVVRKHFTSTRSAGAGEMWLYHRSGGDGLQMTKRPNDQKDAGEPALSPDGRYLYYSQDVSPGSRFEYNKDPNTTIYAIQRLDRTTGETVRFVTGAGGSIRPTPSPDGKHLAFIRRVRYKTCLFVADVASGAETHLYDGLDRDLQETWAIHGVYPGMAWTPDSRSIVFWADGKIQRIDVASKNVTPIPFRVRDTRRIADAVGAPVPVSPAAFHTKMLRWVSVAPKGDRVVYQALGYLYVRDLPNGTPKRLTSQNEHFEFYPSWSRDGKSIVYTTWSDADFGSVRVVSSRGGSGRAVSKHPGHYVEPVFTPDGTRIVYRSVGGGFLRSPRWSRDPGVFWIPAGGGEAQKVTSDGEMPQFGAASDRVYLMRVGGDDGDQRTLVSVELDGSDERTHLNGVYFTEIRVAPNEEWVAWTEGYQAYIAPFVRTGFRVDLGPKAKALPVKRVTRDAGESLHWSGDGTRLYWALGPQLFQRDVRETFAFVDGAPAELPPAPEKGIDIGIDRGTDVPAGTLAFVGARILTMNPQQEVIEDGVVVVEGNKITAVGRRDQVSIPAAAMTFDVAGKTILPGLVDVHWHGALATEEITPQQNWELYAALTFGVTTIHDPSNDTSEIFAASEMQKAGMIVGPRVYSTGTILYGAKGSFKAEIDSLPDARQHMRRMQAVGAFSVKSYNQPRRDQRQQVLAAAHELGMRVYPEGGSLFQHNMNMVVDGHTGIEHSIPVARVYRDVDQLWGQSNVGYTPTLVVGYGGLWGENYWYAHTNVWGHERLTRFVPRAILDARARRPVQAPQEEYGHVLNATTAKQLLDAGVHVQIGAHGQREGLAAHWEIWMLVQGGMLPMQALRAATIDGARYLGMDSEIGSIEPGKLADLLVLDANPLDDIRNSEKVRYTLVNGRAFDAVSMDEVGHRPRPRRAFFWEGDGQALTLQESTSKRYGCGESCSAH
jgi:imidazolonepropionase-like amidohydrolase/Tol biopolymer transport system component